MIHRHGIESEDVAFQIEGAVLDAYPGLTNQVGGHGSGDYGVRHAVEIVAEYTAEPFEAREPLILISIKSLRQQGQEHLRSCPGHLGDQSERARQA